MLERLRRLRWFAPGGLDVRRSGRAVLPAGVGRSADARRALEVERDRAARTEQPVSVLTFSRPSLDAGHEGVPLLVEELARQVRKVDSVVSFDDVQVAVILPHTTAGGAVVLGERVVTDLAARGIEARFKVHSEPRSEPMGGEEPFDDFAPLVGDVVSPMKRSVDVVGGLAALVLLSPVMAAVALYIRAVSPGPALFRQERIGFMGQPFVILKFRTMHVDAEQGSHESHVKRLIREGEPMEKLDARQDPRIIPGGHFLRKTCLDELPQLINVLRGEMSLIGPRPEVPYATDAYRRWHLLRFNAVPGMTGLWQVNRETATTFDEMARLDISYGEDRSNLLDLAILVSTLPIVLFGRNGRSLGS